MTTPASPADPGIRRLLGRELAGSDSVSQRAGAARDGELRTLLGYTAGRRLARARPERARVPASSRADQATAAEEHAGVEVTAGGAVAGSAGEPALLRRRDVTDSLLRLELSRPAGFDYRPGQHVKMGLPGLMRRYSLVSAPHEAHLEFFVEVFPGGRLSSRLKSLRPGTPMALGSRAKGTLAVDPARPFQLMVATVTGVAPYVSMLRHHLRAGGAGPRFVILQGASHADEFGYGDELAAAARRHPDRVTYLPTVSRPESPRSARWTGARGRVGAHVGALVARLGLTPANTAAFACGNPDMVRNVAADLRRRGFDTYTEPFD